eukprot:6592312-Pyramimonas_sp.AAC.1
MTAAVAAFRAPRASASQLNIHDVTSMSGVIGPRPSRKPQPMRYSSFARRGPCSKAVANRHPSA